MSKTVRYGYFFALLPPADLIPAIAHHRDVAGAGRRGKVVDDARLHLSVLGLAVFPEPQPGLVAFAEATLSAAALPDCSPFLDRLVRGEKSMLLTTSGPFDDLRALQGAILKAYHVTSAEIFAKLPKPHLTLRYDRPPAATETIPALSWMASELVLIESHIGLSHHEVRGRWPLRPSFRECFDWVGTRAA